MQANIKDLTEIWDIFIRFCEFCHKNGIEYQLCGKHDRISQEITGLFCRTKTEEKNDTPKEPEEKFGNYQILKKLDANLMEDATLINLFHKIKGIERAIETLAESLHVNGIELRRSLQTRFPGYDNISIGHDNHCSVVILKNEKDEE